MKNSFSKGLAAIPRDPAAAIVASEPNGVDTSKVQLIVRLHADTRRTIKHLAASGDISVQKLMEEAIADLLVKYRASNTG